MLPPVTEEQVGVGFVSVEVGEDEVVVDVAADGETEVVADVDGEEEDVAVTVMVASDSC